MIVGGALVFTPAVFIRTDRGQGGETGLPAGCRGQLWTYSCLEHATSRRCRQVCLNRGVAPSVSHSLVNQGV